MKIKREYIYFAAIVVVTLGAILVVWFYTPAPTVLAQYAWGRYRADTLALTLDRTDASLAYDIGSYYFGNQSMIGTTQARPYNLALAEQAFNKTIVLQPSYPHAYYMRARIEFIHSQFSEAIADLNAELAFYPTDERPLYMRALTYAYRDLPGDLVLAEQDFRDVIAWAPTEWAGYNDLAYVLAKDGNYTDTIPVLKAGIANASGGRANPWLWNSLGVMELNLQEPAAALAAFEKAQPLAAALTDVDWQRAYPGNDPSMAAGGVAAMQSGIAKNIAAARAALGT